MLLELLWRRVTSGDALDVFGLFVDGRAMWMARFDEYRDGMGLIDNCCRQADCNQRGIVFCLLQLAHRINLTIE